jgi:Peptidase family C25
MHKLARTLLFATLATLAFGLLEALPGSPLAANLWANPEAARRVVYIAQDLPDETAIVLGSTLAGSEKPATLLLDSSDASPHLKAFLSAYKPEVVVPFGGFPHGLPDLEQRLGVRAAPALSATGEQPLELWQTLYPKPAVVVVCPPRPRGQLLQAACFAGSLHAPLFVFHGQKGETAQLHKRLMQWETKQVYLIGETTKLTHTLPPMQVHKLPSEEAVAAAHVKQLARQGRIETLVIANPNDYLDNPQPMSPLAPWIALQKHAALLLTNEAGDNVAEVVKAALRMEALKKAENVLYVADLNAIPPVHRPNPITADKDALIEMEPLTPSGNEPFTFAIGRLFHDDPAVVPLMLARQQLLAEATGPRRALVASNAGGSLPLLETFSRNTAKELRNAGYQTTARFGHTVEPDELRRLLRETDIFLWEGHHNTLVRDWGFPTWDEPMPPALVFLQSCLALKEAKVQPLLSRGAVAVVGSSTRTYSASGGACSLAFFNALVYENQSLGGSLRQSKNFLLAYSLLKDKRLGDAATRSGANHRAAWAFTLWGDPTLKMPRPEKPDDALPHIRAETVGNTITITLPDTSHGKVTTAKYQAEMLPNGRLAGLLRKEKEDDGQPLVPFVFTEVQLPKARAGCEPKLHSKMPSSRWVFVYDERRNSGYILVTPRTLEEREMYFRVEWLPVQSAKSAPPMTTGSGQ